MRRRCLGFTLAWLLATVGVGQLVADLTAAMPEMVHPGKENDRDAGPQHKPFNAEGQAVPMAARAEMVRQGKKNDKDNGPQHKPFNSEGQPVLIAAQAEMRCRHAFTDLKRRHKIYRVFLGHSMVPYPGWCAVMEAALRNRCWAEDKLSRDNIEWLRCDTDGRDMLWQEGTVATFKLEVPADSRPKCVAEAVRVSVPGSEVDWMGQPGCYQAYGFEIEH